MSVVLATVAYEGTHFAGWQRQAGQRTVQGCIEEALAAIGGQPVGVRGAGRTDAGVHARGQKISFSWDHHVPPAKLLPAFASLLPADISVRDVVTRPDGFDIKRDSLAKRYVYRVFCAPYRPCLERALVWHHRGALDVGAMRQAAQHLLGEHDFESFRNAGCQQEHARRCLWLVDVQQQAELITIEVRGNAFVRGMVRAISGTLVEVGRGRRTPDEMRAILAACDRTRAGQTAPPHGLTLEEVYLPGDEVRAGIPAGANWPGFRRP